MKTKTYDCVEMKHQGAQRVQQQTQGMTSEEEVEFWRARHEELLRLQAELRARAPSEAPGKRRRAA